MDNKDIVFFDLEVNVKTEKIEDYGGVKRNGGSYHSNSGNGFWKFMEGARYVAGHNILNHDLGYIGHKLKERCPDCHVIDTLYLSALFFAERPYHRLVKDYKLVSKERNNPLTDSELSKEVFEDSLNRFNELKESWKTIYYGLLHDCSGFQGFFEWMDFQPTGYDLKLLIEKSTKGMVCENAEIDSFIAEHPTELAFALAIIMTGDKYSITPPWITFKFPYVATIIHILCGRPCAKGCAYCDERFNLHKKLKQFFGYDEFRSYGGEPLQEKAVRAAVNGKSVLAILPTGGGKSLTFQLPALIAGEAERGLTIVISPLQALMKDQIDSLMEKGISEAVTINGMQDPLERLLSLERLENGAASILYISPESLRSTSLKNRIKKRTIVRVVVDEAHCFSSWGQDFRVDYQYIAKFIKELRAAKGYDIPVSCFTATVKAAVLKDILDYFKDNLQLDFVPFYTDKQRENLNYYVLKISDETNSRKEKYNILRNLIQQHSCPTIVYVSRVKKTIEIADRLHLDGFNAEPFNGQMDSQEKQRIQNAFLKGNTDIIVSTSAFGMGVDKPDVGLVVHYDIPDCIENYVQEAGRAGRDSSIQADCYILYSPKDLEDHFQLLSQTMLDIKDVQKIWKAVKQVSYKKSWAAFSASSIELARKAGWNDNGYGIETAVKTAVSVLEGAGFVERLDNAPHVYADSINAKNIADASRKIDETDKIPEEHKGIAKEIISYLLACKDTDNSNDYPENRVDYIADNLKTDKSEIIEIVYEMRDANILADDMDLSAYITQSGKSEAKKQLQFFKDLEDALIEVIPKSGEVSYKELNDSVSKIIKGSNVKSIKTVLMFWSLTGYVEKKNQHGDNKIHIDFVISKKNLQDKSNLRTNIARFILEYLYDNLKSSNADNETKGKVDFSVIDVKNRYNDDRLAIENIIASTKDVQDAILYLAKIQALEIEGGFLVCYNALQMKRIEKNSKRKFEKKDFRSLEKNYHAKQHMIHSMKKFAEVMFDSEEKGKELLKDYFGLSEKQFFDKWFEPGYLDEITKNMSKDTYERIFGSLSKRQKEIIDDNSSANIVVLAGPGSGKTKVLVHKLASLLLLERVKSDQLLMLTFSRSAAMEFKERLVNLVGNLGFMVKIQTFHSFCFDILGRVGSLDNSDTVISEAISLIESGEVETSQITKSVLVIDESQDMDAEQYKLVQLLMRHNEDIRVIAVGDDDQNIYEFRNSSSEYMQKIITEHNANQYELLENYRSLQNIVRFSNSFAEKIPNRLKVSPIVAVNTVSGLVKIYKHTHSFMEVPLVDQLLRDHYSGTKAILTATNRGTYFLIGKLLKDGVQAHLVQSNDGFRLFDLYGIRSFYNEIKKHFENTEDSIISDEIWDSGKEFIDASFGNSEDHDFICSVIRRFELLNPDKYVSDLYEYLVESKMEDFEEENQNAVVVSTMHRAKGKEFDNVYILLEKKDVWSAQDLRVLYVAMTRAKKTLTIFTNDEAIEVTDSDYVESHVDIEMYPSTNSIVMQLSYDGVVLSRFDHYQGIISKLRSGTHLRWDNGILFYENTGIAMLSKKAKGNLQELLGRGFEVYDAVIRHIVIWKGKDNEKELLIVFPDLYLRRDDHDDQ